MEKHNHDRQEPQGVWMKPTSYCTQGSICTQWFRGFLCRIQDGAEMVTTR